MVDRTIRIAPSILAADFTRLGDQVRAAEDAGADYIHIDVMDGRFVPNITMGPIVVEAVRRVTVLPLDVHLMIVEPERHIAAFAGAGASIITVHAEVSPNLHRTLMAIHEVGCKAGVALNPHTPAVMIREIMRMVDLILVMTVNPGFGGQRFLPETMTKLREIRAMIDDQEERLIDLEVDGGIMKETASTVVEAGADVLVAGSSVFGAAHTIADNMAVLRTALRSKG